MNKPLKTKKQNPILKNILISASIFIITLLIGVLVFIAVCKKDENWVEIPDQTVDTDMSPNTSSENSSPDNGYAADLFEYEEYINPILDMRDEFLLLVSGEKKLSSKFKPDTPTELSREYLRNKETVYLSLYAAKALEAMLIEMEALGIETTDPKTKIDLSVTSGYISYSDQKESFDKEVDRLMRSDPTLTKELAEDIAEVTCPRPGTNEHQCGLAVDIHNTSTDSISFKNSAAYEWLSQNSWRFGYILRYPENKTEITGVQFRPWHFRYVGRYHASRIYKEGLCLEEYLEIIAE